MTTMNTISFPFGLSRNNGEPVTMGSELDVNEHMPQSAAASDPTDITETEQPIDAQTKIDLLSGKWKPFIPLDEYGDMIPTDGCNYALGTIGNIDSQTNESIEPLGFSWDTPLCKHGVSVVFTAASDLKIGLPYSYEDDGDTISPLFPAYAAGDSELACNEGMTYVLFISAILVGMEQVGDDIVFKYANMYSLQELFESINHEAGE